MGKRVGDWIEELFVRKAHLFLEVLNSNWERGEREAEGIARILARHGVPEGARILELGCGNGRVAIPLARRGYHVTCLDISPVFIEDAKRKAIEHGVSDALEAIIGDARRLDKVLADRVFDAAYMVWSTLMGYYLNKSVDIEILKSVRKLVSSNGVLAIVNTTNRDIMVARYAILGSSLPYVSDIGSYVIIEHPKFDPLKSIVTNKWVFYRRRGRDLVYVDEVEFSLRVYTLSEIAEIAEEAGWRLEAAYHDLESLREYIPGRSPFNLIFRAV